MGDEDFIERFGLQDDGLIWDSEAKEELVLKDVISLSISYGRSHPDREMKAIIIAAKALCVNLMADGDHSDLVSDLHEAIKELSTTQENKGG